VCRRLVACKGCGWAGFGRARAGERPSALARCTKCGSGRMERFGVGTNRRYGSGAVGQGALTPQGSGGARGGRRELIS